MGHRPRTLLGLTPPRTSASRPAPDAADPAAVRAYPDDLARLAAEAAHALAPRSTPTEAIDRLVPAAAHLSDLFTTKRPSAFPDYAADPLLRLAYALYFAPQSWVRTRLALCEALEARPRTLGRGAEDGRVSVLDLGAGVGAAGLGAAHALRARGGARRVSLVAVDRSASALDALLATRAASPTLSGIDVTPVHGDLTDLRALDARPGASGPFDLAVASFALNEAFAPDGDDGRARAWIASVAERLTPDGVLLIVEPAQREPATRLRTLVAPLVGPLVGPVAPPAGSAAAPRLHVLAPDLHDGLAPPPADPRFFDHEVRRWRMPAPTARLNAFLRRSLDELTFAFVALSRTPAPAFPAAPRRVRVTSPFGRLKGRRAFTALDAEAGRPTFDLLLRDVSPAEEARLRAVERGDHVEVLDARPLREPGWWRLAGPDALRTAWTPA